MWMSLGWADRGRKGLCFMQGKGSMFANRGRDSSLALRMTRKTLRMTKWALRITIGTVWYDKRGEKDEGRVALPLLPAGDHKGTPPRSTPPSPLRTLMDFSWVDAYLADKSAVGAINRPLRLF